MNTSIQKSVATKPLAVDFDLHTDGDEEFKRELVALMIDNVNELKDSLRKAISQNNLDSFRETCHKVKPTISILNDKELIDVIEEIKHQIDENKKRDAVALFNRLCEYLISGLEEEIK
jgi:hypothetical protein